LHGEVKDDLHSEPVNGNHARERAGPGDAEVVQDLLDGAGHAVNRPPPRLWFGVSVSVRIRLFLPCA
jgi:hypothetical protein